MAVYPCFCLCFTLVQITRTTPLRRTILQFSQMRFTLVLTFMTGSLYDDNPTPAEGGESNNIQPGTEFLKIASVFR
jgi:hypothetical protein